MKNKQVECGYKLSKHETKSMFCYGNEDIKKMIWSLKTDPRFYKSEDGKNLIESVRKEIQSDTKTVVVCVPSSSFWQNKKSFDHMHVFMKNCVKNMKYIPYAIVPKLNKDLQKGLNKKDRQAQTSGAYELSNYFKYFLKTINGEWYILIVDDVKTTGSTLNACAGTVEDYLEKQDVNIKCLAITYEA
jgi:predicted amidophosphoribosyltransferase